MAEEDPVRRRAIRPIVGITAIAAHSALRNANSARIASGQATSPASVRPTASENTTKLAPISIEAFWSAICDNASVESCIVRSV